MRNIQTIDYTLTDINGIKREVLRRYLTGKIGHTLKAYTGSLKAFFDWVDINNHDTVRPDIVAEYKMALESTHLKPASVNRHMAAICDFFKWCYDLGYMPYNAARGIKATRLNENDQDKARALTSKEISRLLGATSKDTDRDRHINLSIQLLFYLGLRVSEVAGIKISDIDLAKREINILGKGRKLRVLGIKDDLYHEIIEHIRHFDYIHADYLIGSAKAIRGKPVSSQHIARTLKELCKEANINPDGIKSHSGRVSAINFLLDNEVPIRDVANFAGHSNTATTMRYDRKAQEKIKQTCNIIDFKEK